MSFVPHHERIASDAAQRWAFVLHGVFGSGANWRMFMRALAAEVPAWGFVLVDHRAHGASLGAPPPHDLSAMAEDLLRLEASLDVPISGVIGHSLGGKVALAYAERRAGALDQVWVLDAQPGSTDEEASPTAMVLGVLEALPESFADRKTFIAALEARGLGRDVAAWLAMSLKRHDDGHHRLGLELDAIAAILHDHFARDTWPELSRRDGRRRLHVVVAGKSFVWRDGDRARLAALASADDSISIHDLPESGHWVHVDAADALRALMVAQLAPNHEVFKTPRA